MLLERQEKYNKQILHERTNVRPFSRILKAQGLTQYFQVSIHFHHAYHLSKVALY